MRRIYNEYRDEEAGRTWPEPSRIPITTTQNRSRGGTRAACWNSDNLDIDMFLFGDDDGRVADELEVYLSERTLRFAGNEERKNFDLAAYWQANSAVYPTLARMFWDITAVTSMSAEPKRVFSG